MKPEIIYGQAREPAPANDAPRRPLTKKETVQLALDQNGRCGCGCGIKLDATREGIIDEHVIPRALGGSDDISNRQLWRKPCSAKKTAEKDIPAIAKVNRLHEKHGFKEPKRKPGPKLRGAGFSNRNRKLNGTVGLTQAAARAAREQ
jgi:5-methylcytosine-specific restriction endonuclease McrA